MTAERRLQINNFKNLSFGKSQFITSCTINSRLFLSLDANLFLHSLWFDIYCSRQILLEGQSNASLSTYAKQVYSSLNLYFVCVYATTHYYYYLVLNNICGANKKTNATLLITITLVMLIYKNKCNTIKYHTNKQCIKLAIIAA